MKFLSKLRENRKGITGLVIGMVVVLVKYAVPDVLGKSLCRPYSNRTACYGESPIVYASVDRFSQYNRLQRLQQRLLRL
jgi:hypothetical protein